MNLREWRVKKAVSLEDLSRKAGVSVVTIIDIEKGRHPSRHTTKRKIARALSLRPEDIDF